jgi:hypothetical protein
MQESSDVDATAEGTQSADTVQPPTAPETISLNLRGFDAEEHARDFGNLVATYVRELSRYIDLSTLDGITVASNYAQALLDLDRGYATSLKLTPSDRLAYGIAMTPAVVRDGKIKSHMVFNAGVLLPLEDSQSDMFKLALHTLAHECAHVEVTERFNAAFPGVLLQSKARNAHDDYRWQIIKACWDEYAVTLICAPFGEQPTAGYEETFIRALEETRPRANSLIKAYRLHQNVEQITAEIYGTYGDLMKFASYHLGNMAGLGITLDDLPKTKAALEGHSFAAHFVKLKELCESIATDYGNWTDRSKFETIGNLADEIVVEGGLIVSDFRDDGGFYVHVRPPDETIPDLPE